jgi:hypothetical protein
MKLYQLIFLLILLFPFVVSGQKKEKIRYEADELKFKRVDKEPIRKLKNNVIFRQGDTEVKVVFYTAAHSC